MDDAQMQENLRYIVHHVFMPPKLPQQEEQEPDFYGKEHTLCQVALGCATRFFDQSANQLQNYRHEGAQIIKMLECFVNLNGPRPFEREDLVHQLENMVVGGTSRTLGLIKPLGLNGICFRYHTSIHPQAKRWCHLSDARERRCSGNLRSLS